MTSSRSLAGQACLGLVVLLLAACTPTAGRDGGAAPEALEPERTQLEVNLGEWFIAPETTEFPSGAVTLVVRNNGREVHELEVIRKVAQYQEYEVAELEDIGPGETLSLDLGRLAPGTYELVCTIVKRTPKGRIFNHYRFGMSASISVPDN